MRTYLIAFLALAALAPPAGAFEYPEHLRSDLPFWGDQGGGIDSRFPNASPYSCGTLGWCTRIAFGDWKYTYETCMEFADKVTPTKDGWELGCKKIAEAAEWMRFDLRSIHDGGGYITEGASTREELDHAKTTYSVIGGLGKAPNGEELFAIQLGFMGGSSYVLLAGKPDADGGVRTFRELFPKCDKKTRGVDWREADFYSFHNTGYCVVRRPAQLRDLALAALNGESRTWKWVGEPPRWEKPKDASPAK